MMPRRALVCCATLLFTGAASALDYRSINEAAVLYDAPSQKARPLFVIAAGTPVEAVVTLDAWVKIRDMKGDLAWIERRQLAEQRFLQVRATRAQIRVGADESAALVFEAETDVLLELVEPGPAGWVKVRHRDGQQGFVKAGQIWGL
ncbi:MAG: SH3 domain-containing protein [Rhodocyclaceae bacterium]|nr:SH3 domain-containing protein [Rhodocyclaceae bacterium]MDP1956636.1 SH3 domain-containing protein [Rhodocyclaceae bacterium]